MNNSLGAAPEIPISIFTPLAYVMTSHSSSKVFRFERGNTNRQGMALSSDRSLLILSEETRHLHAQRPSYSNTWSTHHEVGIGN